MRTTFVRGLYHSRICNNRTPFLSLTFPPRRCLANAPKPIGLHEIRSDVLSSDLNQEPASELESRVRPRSGKNQPHTHLDPDEANDKFWRDACQCPHCVDPSTRQKKFHTADVPANLRIRSQHQTEDGLRITWENDIHGYDNTHVSTFSNEEQARLLSILRVWSGSFRRRKRWTGGGSKPYEVNFEDYMNDEAEFSSAMRELYLSGILFIRQSPEEEGSVSRIAEKIGPLRNTFYGETWDVKSKPNAENVAYTSEDLGYHMDLLYMSKPPSYQLLHCMKNSCPGGESLFVDSFEAARLLREESQDLYDTLRRRPVEFQYRNGTKHYRRVTNTIVHHDEMRSRDLIDARIRELSGTQKIGGEQFKLRRANYLQQMDVSPIASINWSPPFQAPLPFQKKFDVLFQAIKRFSELLSTNQDIRHQLKMEPGTCVIFENQRIVHARKAFRQARGRSRWLRGAYLDDDDFLSCCYELASQEPEFWGDAMDLLVRPDDLHAPSPRIRRLQSTSAKRKDEQR